MKNIKLFSIFLAVFIFSLAFIGCSKATNPDTNKTQNKQSEKIPDKVTDNMLNIGDLAPNFELADIKGNIHKLSDYKGKKVYIKVWASWCSICLAGLDEVDTLSAGNNDFVVLTIVSPDFRGEKNKDDFIKWFDSLGKKNTSVLLDTDGTLTNKLGVRGYPTSVFIGSDGVLVKTLPGHKSNENITLEYKSIK